jgi:hypothetical protein
MPVIEQRLHLSLLPDTFAVCRLDREAAIPDWAQAAGFMSVTRTADELSIVCAERHLPEGMDRQGGWRVLKVAGPLDFSLTGILASITAPLAQAAIPVFAISTYETDYLLVKQDDLEQAAHVMSAHGHHVSL